MIDVKISKSPLNLEGSIKKVSDKSCGGIAIFLGTARDKTDGRRVKRLEFETYEKMALLELKKIANEALKRWKIKHIVIHHRDGVVPAGEMAVLIIVVAERRDPAFKACRYAIDTLKKTVPIWKKEIFEDGEAWVTPHP